MYPSAGSSNLFTSGNPQRRSASQQAGGRTLSLSSQQSGGRTPGPSGSRLPPQRDRDGPASVAAAGRTYQPKPQPPRQASGGGEDAGGSGSPTHAQSPNGSYSQPAPRGGPSQPSTSSAHAGGATRGPSRIGHVSHRSFAPAQSAPGAASIASQPGVAALAPTVELTDALRSKFALLPRLFVELIQTEQDDASETALLGSLADDAAAAQVGGDLADDERAELRARFGAAREKQRAQRERARTSGERQFVETVMEGVAALAGMCVRGEFKLPQSSAEAGERGKSDEADAAHLSTLTSTVDSLTSTNATLRASLDALTASHTTLESQLSALTERLAALEARPAPAPAPAPVKTVETVPRAELDAVTAKYDLLALRFAKLEALVGTFPPSPSSAPTSASSALGKRAFPDGADEPALPHAQGQAKSAPNSSAAPAAGAGSLATRLSAAEERLAAVERARVEVEKEKEKKAKDGAAMVLDADEKRETEQRAREEEERKKRDEGMEKLEKRVEQLGLGWKDEIGAVDKRVSTLASNVSALKAAPAPTPSASVSSAALDALRTDLTALSTRLDTALAALPPSLSASQLALVDALHAQYAALAQPLTATPEPAALKQAVTTRFRALDALFVSHDAARSDLASTSTALDSLRARVSAVEARPAGTGIGGEQLGSGLEGKLVALEVKYEKLRGLTRDKFESMRDLVVYLESSALPEFERVAQGYTRLQLLGRLPSDDELQVKSVRPLDEEADRDEGEGPAPRVNGTGTSAPAQAQALTQGQPAPQPPAQAQIQPAAPHAGPNGTHGAAPYAGGFAGDEEEDELDDDDDEGGNLVAPEGEDEGSSFGAGGGGGSAGGDARMYDAGTSGWA
ncbi:hypothetical protein JCM10207_007116 [Rhodosporidiobolus poonsookiae]